MEGINSGSSLVRWIEGHRFFGRPRLEKKQILTCQDAAKLADYVIRVSTCRTKAAYTCVTPDVGVYWTGDACVCSTLWGYASKFSACIADTPYSNCYNAASNNIGYSSWSTDHCKITTIITPSPSPRVVTSSPKPVVVTSIVGPVTTVLPPPPLVTSKVEPRSSLVSSAAEAPKPPATSGQPRAPDPSGRSTFGPILPAPGPTSDKPEVKSDKSPATSQSTPTSVPDISLVTVVVAPRTSSESTDVSVTPSASRIPLARWNGNGALLNGYCASLDYTIINGPTAYWAPVLGCIQNKADCCPFDIAPSTVAIAARAADTDTPNGALGSNGGFPSAVSSAQATLSKCPSDYHSIGNGCCPSNYFPWTTTFGGQTPCYSTLPGAITPPPIGANIPSNPSQPTSAIVNIVYAMQYPLIPTEPAPKPGLATGAKIGIGAGAGVAALVFGVLMFLLLRKHRAHKKDKAALDEMSGVGSTRQSVAHSSTFGGVKGWQTKVAMSEVSSGLEPIQEPTLPQVAIPQYPADWHPGQRTVSPPVPGYYARDSVPSPPITEVGSENGRVTRSELHSEYGVQRQELQGGYHHGYEEWQHQGVAQQVRYYEAPAGRATPRPN